MTGGDRADVAFTSTVRAEEISFREVPGTRVTFTGDASHRSTSGSDRTGLPERVSPRVVYRDIQVDYWIVARLNAEFDEPFPGGDLDGRG